MQDMMATAKCEGNKCGNRKTVVQNHLIPDAPLDQSSNSYIGEGMYALSDTVADHGAVRL